MESDTTTAVAPPPKVLRPALALWMFERGLRPKDGEEPLSVGREQVRRYCLPFSDEMRVIPPEPVMRRIREWTAGQVGPGSFYEPEPGSPVSRDPEWAERRRQADAIAEYPGMPDARP